MNIKKIREAIGLLSCMVECGEKHSAQSRGIVQEAINELTKIENQLGEAIDLLKEFAFYCVDLSVEEHCEHAARVQEFLKKTSAKDWIEEQLRLAKCEYCEEYDECKNQDGICEKES